VADVGESLVGSYLRYIVGCDIVAYNVHTPDVQGELDVIGIQTATPRTVWLCEVVTHLRGTLYAGGYAGTVEKIRDKIGRARNFATTTFSGDLHRYEIWSPIVPSGVAQQFDELAAEFSTQELDVEFVINRRYTERVEELVAHARGSFKATNEPAYRLLQILTHLRGDLRV
jgi:hypothetical protein